MPDWLFQLIGLVLAAAGAVVLAWALFWDRSRGRKRCPKCWYSMDGAPGLMCPECGKVVKSERKLRKTRRRWRGAVVAVVVFALAYGLGVTPRVQKRGWPAAVPTAALIVACRWMGQSELFGLQRRQVSAAQRAWNELAWERPKRMWSWERWLAVESCIRGDVNRPPESEAWVYSYGRLYEELQSQGAVSDGDRRRLWKRALPQIVETRDTWPVGSKIYASVRPPLSMVGERVRLVEVTVDPGGNSTLVAQLPPFSLGRRLPVLQMPPSAKAIGVAPDAGIPVNVVVRLYELSTSEWSWDSGWKRNLVEEWTLERRIDVVSSIDEALPPVDSSDLNSAIAAGLSLQYMPPVLYVDLSPAAQARLEGVAVAFHVEFVRKGEVRAQGASLWHRYWGPMSGARGSMGIHISGDTDALERALVDGEQWTVRIRGDPTLALEDIGCRRYWKGQTELPLMVVDLVPKAAPYPRQR